MKKFSVVIAAILLVCMVFSVACQKEDEGSKNNFGKELLTYASQLDALNGLKKGDADIAVIDSVMAGYYMNDTDSFKDYQILENIVLAEEKYGIAAKKGNDALMSKINEALIALVDTDYKTIAATYGLTTELLVKADTVNPLASANDESWNNVVKAKKLIVGYTLFAPIAYNEGDGENAVFKGFDIDLAKAVVNYLNTKYEATIKVEFMEIDWDSKEALLENGTIDLVWNGMTITEEAKLNASVSDPYVKNAQVVVMAKDKIAEYADVESLKGLKFAAEAGSAGEAAIKEKK